MTVCFVGAGAALDQPTGRERSGYDLLLCPVKADELLMLSDTSSYPSVGCKSGL